MDSVAQQEMLLAITWALPGTCCYVVPNLGLVFFCGSERRACSRTGMWPSLGGLLRGFRTCFSMGFHKQRERLAAAIWHLFNTF